MNNEIIKFVNGDLQLDVTVSPDNETVWLTANQMALLFDRDEKTIRKHINNTFKDQEVEKENNTQKMRVVGVKQPVPFYSLDIIVFSFLILKLYILLLFFFIYNCFFV